MLRTAAVAAVASAANAASWPTIAGDWSAFVTQTMVVAQGGYALNNGDQCCPSASSNCQVQVQTQVGPNYYSVNNQAVASMNPDGTGIISLFNTTILMEVSVDADLNCQESCPIDPEEAPLTAYSLVNTTDIGASTVRGIKCEGYQNINQFFNITMETDTVWVNQANYNNAVLVFEYDQITPFGQPAGESNTTYVNFKTAPQPAALFAVKGLSTCQQSQGCNQQSERLLHRRMVSKAKYWKSIAAAKEEEAKKISADL